MPTKSEKPAKAELAISEDGPRLETRNPKQAEIIAVNFESAGGVTAGLVTAHPKPAKRLNAKQRAQENKRKVQGRRQGRDHAGYEGKGEVQSGSQGTIKGASKGQAQEEQGSRLSPSLAARVLGYAYLECCVKHSPPSAPGCVKRPPPKTGAKAFWEPGSWPGLAWPSRLGRHRVPYRDRRDKPGHDGPHSLPGLHPPPSLNRPRNIKPDADLAPRGQGG